MDVFSRLVTGFHVSLEPESWFEAMIAVENAASNKVEFCAKHNIPIKEEEWPSHYLPSNLVGDRGELKAKDSERFVNLNVDVLNAPSYRGDLKPYVESNFHITNEMIRQLLSGSTEAQQWVRGDKNPAKDAALTVEEFCRFMIVYILTYNKRVLNKEYIPTKDMFVDKVDLTPISVWNWSGSSQLLHERSKDELIYNLYPRAEAKVSRYGIEYRNLCFTSDVAIKKGWFDGNGNGIDGKKDIEITYDPRNCSTIFLKYKTGLITLQLTGKYKEFEGLCFAEVDKIFEYRDNQIKLQTEKEAQHLAELNAFADDLNNTATNEMKIATKNSSFYSRNKGKREARKQDGKKWSASVAHTSSNSSEDTTGKNNGASVIPFHNAAQEQNDESQDMTNDIYSLFSRKNNVRRGRDSDE
jgi:hypothetical protein